MFDTHVYEVLPGEVLLRRSGNASRTFISCKVIRTRAIAAQLASGWKVSVALLTTGYEPLFFTEWFKDWDWEDDNLGHDYQGGRPIEVLVKADMLDQMIATGRPINYRELSLENNRLRPFRVPLVAVRVGERWIEPEGPISLNTPNVE